MRLSAGTADYWGEIRVREKGERQRDKEFCSGRMSMSEIYDEIKRRLFRVLEGRAMLTEKVHVKARPLSSEEAIGNPEADDFPLQKGKERLMQAEFHGSLGQAFTDQYGDFEGTLKDVAEMPLRNNFRRSVFVATLNAVLRSLDQTDGTVHCHDKGPGECALELVAELKERYGDPRILQVGFQPRMVEYLAPRFSLRVLDMDKDNIGSKKFDVMIEGHDAADEAIEWADLLFVTGTTLVNDTIGQFLGKKRVLFYGTTIAGAASIMGWDRFCARST
jgi:hypothetical protein